MSKTVLVTGVNGFVGHHTARMLKEQGFSVIGSGMQPEASPRLKDYLDDYQACDMTDEDQIKALPLEGLTAIINLAGISKIGDSIKNPELCMQVNTYAVETIIKMLFEKNQTSTRLLAVSSGAIYDSQSPTPFTEDSPLMVGGPPYVESKIAMEKTCSDYKAKGLDIVVARPFNHIGPGQEPGFLIPDLAIQATEAITNDQPIGVGNLETKRDYTDVRDVVTAYIRLATGEAPKHDLYNVCSGRSIAGRKLLEQMLALMAPPKIPEIVIDPEKMRASDAMDIYGSYQRLQDDTGWTPKIPIEQTLKDFLATKDA